MTDEPQGMRMLVQCEHGGCYHPIVRVGYITRNGEVCVVLQADDYAILYEDGSEMDDDEQEDTDE